MYNPMEYLGIRLTHPDNVYDPAWDSMYIDKISQVLNQLGTITKSTYGHEISVKSHKHHFHWHVQLERHSDAKQVKGISNYVKRHLKETHQLELPKGQGYSIKTVKPDTDILRWHGYVFKDLPKYEDIVMIHQLGFSGEELLEMWSAAHRERELSIKTFQKHENKLNNDKQSRKLLWEWLDQQIPEDLLAKDGALSEFYPNPHRLVAEKIVEYNIKYNDYKIPMDLKRRAVSYLAYKGMMPSIIANLIL